MEVVEIDEPFGTNRSEWTNVSKRFVNESTIGIESGRVVSRSFEDPQRIDGGSLESTNDSDRIVQKR